MTSQSRTMILFGAGPNIGRSVAAKFASKGFDHIVLLSRNAHRLQEDETAVRKAASKKNIRIDKVVADLSDETSMQKAFAEIDGLVESVEAVIFNGARVAPSDLFKYPVEGIINDFKITTIGLYLVSQWAIPKLQALAKTSPASKPSLIVTSGILHRDPWPTYFSLCVAKTAQRNLVDNLYRVYNGQGLHIGLVLIGGIVMPNLKVLNPPNVGEVTWDFFDSEATRNLLEVEMHEPLN